MSRVLRMPLAETCRLTGPRRDEVYTGPSTPDRAWKATRLLRTVPDRTAHVPVSAASRCWVPYPAASRLVHSVPQQPGSLDCQVSISHQHILRIFYWQLLKLPQKLEALLLLDVSILFPSSVLRSLRATTIYICSWLRKRDQTCRIRPLLIPGARRPPNQACKYCCS